MSHRTRRRGERRAACLARARRSARILTLQETDR